MKQILLLTIFALEILSTSAFGESVNTQATPPSTQDQNQTQNQRFNEFMGGGNTQNQNTSRQPAPQPMTVIDQGGSLKAVPRTSPNQSVILPAESQTRPSTTSPSITRPVGGSAQTITGGTSEPLPSVNNQFNRPAQAAAPQTFGAPPSTTNTGVPQTGGGTNLPLNQPAGPINVPATNSGVSQNPNQPSSTGTPTQTPIPQVMTGPTSTSTQAITAPNQPFGVPNQAPAAATNQGVPQAQGQGMQNANPTPAPSQPANAAPPKAR